MKGNVCVGLSSLLPEGATCDSANVLVSGVRIPFLGRVRRGPGEAWSLLPLTSTSFVLDLLSTVLLSSRSICSGPTTLLPLFPNIARVLRSILQSSEPPNPSKLLNALRLKVVVIKGIAMSDTARQIANANKCHGKIFKTICSRRGGREKRRASLTRGCPRVCGVQSDHLARAANVGAHRNAVTWSKSTLNFLSCLYMGIDWV